MEIETASKKQGGSEQSLVARAKAGDQTAFEELIRAYEPRIYNLLLRMTSNPAEAGDLFQETFLSAWKNLSRFQGKAAFSTWLYRIAFNAALMRKRKRKLATVSLDAPLNEDGSAKNLDFIQDWSDNPLASLENLELRDRLNRSLEQLPEKYRSVLILSDLQGLPNAEIAQITEQSLASVKSRLHRARLFMRDQLSEYFKEHEQP